MRFRSVRLPHDLAAVDGLFALAEECDGHRPIGEHKYLDLLHSDPTEVVGMVGEDTTGEIAAYAALSEFADGVWGLEMALHPLHRSPANLRALIRAAVDEAASREGRVVRAWAFQPNLAAELERCGFENERELRQIRIALPVRETPSFPDTIDVRPFRPDLDEDAWLEVNNRAFAGHPENGEWTRPVLDDRKQQGWWDPDGFRMAWEGDRIVGFCWTKLHADAVGEIYVIAVDPDEQGRGLGRALALEGLRYLAVVHGCIEGMLYVDAFNAPANALYDSLGFRLDHVDRSYTLTIAPG
ncbi:MAG: mycothiol synthase [Acidimicrobiia bacterium]|jgi:mycothiol synthase